MRELEALGLQSTQVLPQQRFGAIQFLSPDVAKRPLMGMGLGKLRELVMDRPGVLQFTGSQRVGHD